MLLGDRNILETDTTNICNSVVPQKGACATYLTAGSGSAINDVNQGFVALPSNPSGLTPAGIFLSTFVNIDQTRQHRNFHKDEQVVGEKAPLMTKGWLVTDQVLGTPTVGQTAYISATSGFLTPTVSATGGIAATPKVGMFKSVADENGFVKVEVQLPAI